MSGDQVHVFAKIVAQEDKADEVRAVLTELVTAVRREVGVVGYVLHEDTKRPGMFLFFESYESQEAVDRHMKSPHMAKAFSTVEPMLAARPEIHVTKVVQGE